MKSSTETHAWLIRSIIYSPVDLGIAHKQVSENESSKYSNSLHQEIGENMIKRCMTHDINTINIPQYNPSQWGVIKIGF